MSRIEAGLLARQAGVADEVWRDDIRGGLHQGDVVVQLAVSRVTEVLVAVDPLHGEDPLCCLWALQLVLPQDDPPAPSILCFTPERPERKVKTSNLLFCSVFFFCIYVFLLLEAVSSSEDPVLVDESSSTDMNVMFTSPGTNLRETTTQMWDYFTVHLKLPYISDRNCIILPHKYDSHYSHCMRKRSQPSTVLI